MKELKFRVYDRKERYYSDKPFSIDQLGICYIQDEDGYWEEIDEERFVVEQYTGLKDRDSKEIYEGDIIKQDMHWSSRKWPPYMIWRVASDEDVSAFELIRLSGRKYMSGGYLISIEKEDYEVIGNIHENPELLGGGE